MFDRVWLTNKIEYYYDHIMTEHDIGLVWKS